MKKTYQYIALAVLTLGMAACSQEDDFIPQGNHKGAPLAIASAGVADLTTRATITTIEETDYLTGNRFNERYRKQKPRRFSGLYRYPTRTNTAYTSTTSRRHFL